MYSIVVKRLMGKILGSRKILRLFKLFFLELHNVSLSERCDTDLNAGVTIVRYLSKCSQFTNLDVMPLKLRGTVWLDSKDENLLL